MHIFCYEERTIDAQLNLLLMEIKGTRILSSSQGNFRFTWIGHSRLDRRVFVYSLHNLRS